VPGPLVAGHCDLCDKAPKGGRHKGLSWDHDHVLEELGFSPAECHRGWLCFHCNTGLGKLGDDARSLARALAYVSYRPRKL
jgi:hypothetical protein